MKAWRRTRSNSISRLKRRDVAGQVRISEMIELGNVRGTYRCGVDTTKVRFTIPSISPNK